MKVLLPTILYLLLLVNAAFAQTNDDSEIIQDIVKRNKFSGTVVYTDRGKGQYFLNRLFNVEWKFQSERLEVKELQLTEEERIKILKQSKKPAKYVWDTDLLPRSVRISRDSIFTYSEMKNCKTAKDSLNLLNQLSYTWVWSFSKPVYLRKNSVAIIQYTETCGHSCGYAKTWIYKKIDGEWVYWMSASSGAW